MGTLILGAVVVAVLWGTLFSVLSVDWSTNPQYGYGWFMPLLAAGLFWKRWQVRPRAEHRRAEKLDNRRG